MCSVELTVPLEFLEVKRQQKGDPGGCPWEHWGLVPRVTGRERLPGGWRALGLFGPADVGAFRPLGAVSSLSQCGALTRISEGLKALLGEQSFQHQRGGSGAGLGKSFQSLQANRGLAWCHLLPAHPELSTVNMRLCSNYRTRLTGLTPTMNLFCFITMPWLCDWCTRHQRDGLCPEGFVSQEHAGRRPRAAENADEWVTQSRFSF